MEEKDERLQDYLPEERHTYYIIKDYKRMSEEVDYAKKMMKQASKRINDVLQSHAKWQEDREKIIKKIWQLEKDLAKTQRKNEKLRKKINKLSNAKLGTFLSKVIMLWLLITGHFNK